MPTPREMMEAARRKQQMEELGASPRMADDPRSPEGRAYDEPASRGTTGRRQNMGRATTWQGAERTSRQREQAPAQRSQRGTRPSGQNVRASEAHRRQQQRGARAIIARWRMYGVAAFAALMLLGGVIGLLFFARPTTSAVEMRNLTTFPEFSVESFLDGSFFTDLSLWYADTYPLREPMVAADHGIDKLFGVNTGSGMVGGNVQADEIPVDTESTEAEPEPEKVRELAEAPTEKAIAEDVQANIMEGVYVTNGAGYAVYYFSQYAADTYVAAMNAAAEKLDGVATVYSLLAPANCVTLSDEEAAKVGGSDQEQTIAYLDSRFDERVVSVHLIDTMKEHRDEYLFFHTDHHWTQLGAYYAYVEFCKAKGIEPKQLSDWRQVNLGELQGTYTETIQSMGYYPSDTVDAYIPASTNDLTYWTEDGQEVASHVIEEEAATWEPSYKYMAFAAGDRPLEIIENPELDDGSSCLVVKDSYGCAFVPTLVDNYQTVHVIDFRYTDKNLCDYVIENGIQDVLFVNGMKIGLADTAAAAILAEVS